MALPEPTTDLDRHKADLDEFGYCIVADALSAEQATALKERIGAQAAAERDRDLDFHYPADGDDDVNQWVYQLLAKGDEFQALALHPTARALAGQDLVAEAVALVQVGDDGLIHRLDEWINPAPLAPLFE